MKKIISLFLIVVTGFVFFGYNSSKDSKEAYLEKFVFENESFGIDDKITNEIFENIEQSEKYQVILELYDNYEPLEKPTKELTVKEAKEFFTR